MVMEGHTERLLDLWVGVSEKVNWGVGQLIEAYLSTLSASRAPGLETLLI
jgi:hypothetical protein